LVARYGTKYAGSYGWAHDAVAAHDPRLAQGRIGIPVIEKCVSLDHLRPYYRMASHGIHANPKGILFTPDVLDSEPEILLAGPGSTGFADAGQCALISLNQITATLVTYKTGEAAPLVLTALLRLVEEAKNPYVETQHDVRHRRNAPRFTRLDRLRYRVVPRLAVVRVQAVDRIVAVRARAPLRPSEQPAGCHKGEPPDGRAQR